MPLAAAQPEPRRWHDPKYASNDSVHSTWVNDIGDKIANREAQGYRVVTEFGKRVEMDVGNGVTGVLMQIPQADFQRILSPRPEGMPSGVVLESMNPYQRVRSPPVERDEPEESHVEPLLWSKWRIFNFHRRTDEFIGLLNWKRQTHAVRLAVRYHNDEYFYIRLHWKPWKFTAEKRTRFTETARLNAKIPGEMWEKR